jgi:hypothetical protein
MDPVHSSQLKCPCAVNCNSVHKATNVMLTAKCLFHNTGHNFLLFNITMVLQGHNNRIPKHIRQWKLSHESNKNVNIKSIT